MGVYLVSVSADDWANDELLLAVRPELDRALNGAQFSLEHSCPLRVI